ncbi:hypothetical protein Tco_0859618 [Tanacetum coccineum]|uniref:Uncharacterized protein n=1 Tax=Tanacetum coccineum TaxID=301880 RepID=A0ABQ5BCH6_9ASTR
MEKESSILSRFALQHLFRVCLLLMPRFAPTIKSLLCNKKKLLELVIDTVDHENCSACSSKSFRKAEFTAICEVLLRTCWISLFLSGGNPTPTSEPFTSEFIWKKSKAYLKDDSILPEIDHDDCDGGRYLLIEELLIMNAFLLPPMDLKQSEVTKAKNLHEELRN